MKKIEDLKVKRIIHTVGLNNNLTDEQVKEIVESQFRFAFDQIRKIEFEGLSNEEIDELKTNFYFKYIGKLYTNGDVLERAKRRIEIIKKLTEEKRERDGRERES